VCRQPGVRWKNYRIWFERWIREGYSVRQLSQVSGLSRATLHRIILHWLSQSPPWQHNLGEYRYLVMDGSYLEGRKEAIIGLADPTRNCLVAGIYGIKEGEARMYDYCRLLAQAGLSPRSVTIDGLWQVHVMINTIWPSAAVQRCLVHIQRQGLAWCRHQPKREETRQLRQLFTRLTNITTPAQRDRFIADWQRWETTNGHAVAACQDLGWVIRDFKKARTLLLRALPYLFDYLDNRQIPPSTNWLESYFSRLKAHYRQHRGLAAHHRKNYFAWYFHLCKK
jgi:transposase-like protein